MDGRALQGLQELLNPAKSQEEEQRCSELDAAATAYATPGAIGQPASGRRADSGGGDMIWRAEEVQEEPQYDHDDPRPEPQYEVVFSQRVGTEDIFLGMSGKNPATASCHHQLVRIFLPATELEEVELRVTDTFLHCYTPHYRLGLHLPNRVEGERSRAKWLADSHTLEVTLQLNRDYEDLNP